jgi:hypothetical protein
MALLNFLHDYTAHSMLIFTIKSRHAQACTLALWEAGGVKRLYR